MKLKTRTNQPVYYKLPVSSNIQSLSDDLLNSLRVGDVVQKKTGNQKHCYIVTYKEEKHGICLTYVDCGYMETISYDYVGGHWVFNSKDVKEVPTDESILSMLESKDVKVKTLKQSEPNSEFTSGITYNSALSPVQGGYAGVKEINGVLYLIIAKQFNVLSNMGATNFATIPLPEELLNKINTLDNAFTSGTVFCDSGSYQKTGAAALTLAYKIIKGANALNIDLQTNVALVQGNVVEMFIRTFIALI